MKLAGCPSPRFRASLALQEQWRLPTRPKILGAHANGHAGNSSPPKDAHKMQTQAATTTGATAFAASHPSLLISETTNLFTVPSVTTSRPMPPWSVTSCRVVARRLVDVQSVLAAGLETDTLQRLSTVAPRARLAIDRLAPKTPTLDSPLDSEAWADSCRYSPWPDSPTSLGLPSALHGSTSRSITTSEGDLQISAWQQRAASYVLEAKEPHFCRRRSLVKTMTRTSAVVGRCNVPMRLAICDTSLSFASRVKRWRTGVHG
jgi:hypothetical protein